MKIVLKDEILKLRVEGNTYKSIRKILGCTLSVISYHCSRAGLNHSNTQSKPTIEQIEEINYLYNTGLSIAQVAKKVNRNRHSVSTYILIKRGNIGASRSVVDWRKRTKKKLVEYKGGKCFKCGYNKCVEALDFHHVDPKEKDFTIGGKSWSFERLKSEVDKCVLVCRNCHAEIHAGLIDVSVVQRKNVCLLSS